MGIVRGADGRVYNIPDEELSRFAVAEDSEVEKRVPKPSALPRPRMSRSGGGPVVIQVFTRGPRPTTEPDVTAQSAWGGWGARPRAVSQPHFQQIVIWPT